MIILIIIACIIAVPLIAALFLSKDYAIERETVIDKPTEMVFSFVKLISNHTRFNKWMMADPKVRIEYSGTDGTVGFVSAWDSDVKRVGKGDQEITNVVTGQRIDIAIRFVKPFEGNAKSFIITESLPDGTTRVKWIFSGSRNYVTCIMHLIFNLPKVLGKDLQTSLGTLKIILEN